jgi:hypothetical protein
LRATDRIDHGANGAFAVCAGDVDNFGYSGARRGRRRAFDINAATTFVQQTPGIFQPEFDPEALEAVKPGERRLIIDRRISRCANRRGGPARPSRLAPASSVHGVTAK